jgi:TonB family protein
MHMAVNDKLSPFLVASVGLHIFVVAAVLIGPSLLPVRSQTSWGTNKGIRVGVASSLPGIALPSPRVVQETAKGNDSKTLNPRENTPKAAALPDVDAVKIPTGAKKPEKNRQQVASNVEPPKDASLPSNAVPGRGGQVALPYGQDGAGSGPASFGDAGFGSRFPEYVRTMTTAIRSAWASGVQQGIPPRVYVTFTIGKDGKVSNPEVAKSSGSLSLDNSAMRAVMTAKLPPLPREYSGSSVDVRFYFEYTH